MQILDLELGGSDYLYQWPSGNEEPYSHWVEYSAVSEDGDHRVRIGFGMRHTYGRDRKRVVVWLDGHPHAEFLGADYYEHSSDLLCEIKVPGETGERKCRYPSETVPERYAGLPVVGLRTRVTGSKVHHAWSARIACRSTRVLCVLDGAQVHPIFSCDAIESRSI